MLGPRTGQDASARGALGPRLLVSRHTVGSLCAWVWGPQCTVRIRHDSLVPVQ